MKKFLIVIAIILLMINSFLWIFEPEGGYFLSQSLLDYFDKSEISETVIKFKELASIFDDEYSLNDVLEDDEDSYFSKFIRALAVILNQLFSPLIKLILLIIEFFVIIFQCLKFVLAPIFVYLG